MNRNKKYVILGAPIPWARAGVNNGKFFDKQKLAKMQCVSQFENQHKNEPLFEGPIQMDFCFFMPIPQSKSKKVQVELIDKWHHIKPDCSNLIKFYEDAAIGILYRDDALISKETIQKKYDDGQGPRVEIIIWELE